MVEVDWRPLKGSASSAPRWKRYRLVFIVLLVILTVQLLLGYQSNKLDEDGGKGTSGGDVRPSLFFPPSGGSLPLDDDDNQPSNSNHHQHPAGREDFLRSVSSIGEAGNHPAAESKKEAAKMRHLDGLSFNPTCEVQSRDAHSAVNRAKTEDCKRQILDTVCAIESGTFYAEQLTSRCPKGNFTRGRSLGCFQDD